MAQKAEEFRYWFHHEHLFIDQVDSLWVALIKNGITDIAYYCQGFDQQAWIRHRSWRRHLPEGFATVRVLHSLGYPVFFYIAVSLLVCSYAHWAEVNPPSTGFWRPYNLTVQFCNSALR